ncbi:hypothetical protein [Marinicellulosiphila megalodicopiae]|uniref:hypothetical protein n=1 Tax=Marinicellulosiphila megalodicopiae TaxID=2724896 RepID=UPI003BB1828D
MNPASITNAQLHYAKQLLTHYSNSSLPLDESLVKQCLFAQFKLVIHALVSEIGRTYELNVLEFDQSVIEKINGLTNQTDGIAELAILNELILSGEENFFKKILNFQLVVPSHFNEDAIFKTFNTEQEILNELINLIQSIRELSVQQ